MRYLRRSYYVACIAVSVATLFASWWFWFKAWELVAAAVAAGALGLVGEFLAFPPEAWELGGAMVGYLGCIPSAVLSMIVLFWLLGRGQHPKPGRSRTTTLSGAGSPDEPPADAPHREVPKSSAETPEGS